VLNNDIFKYYEVNDIFKSYFLKENILIKIKLNFVATFQWS